MSTVIENDKKQIASTYARFPVEIASGKGSVAYGDVDRLYVRFDCAPAWAKPWIKRDTEAYVKATNGVIMYSDLRTYIDNTFDTYDDSMNGHWGGNVSPLDPKAITVTITKAVEGGKGLVEDGKVGVHANGMLAVTKAEEAIILTKDANGNYTNDEVMITGAEIGDKFIATYTIDGHPVTHTINFTVGSDTTAWFSDHNTDCDYR